MLSLDSTPVATQLPPLILHPFSDQHGPNKLVESSRASLMLQGLLPSGQYTPEQLDLTLLEGRYCEIRMLYYVGKDLSRWIEQCMEAVERSPELQAANVRYQSFAALLVEDPPESVRTKLRKWGVADYKAIFCRALGLHSMFSRVPDRESLSDEFIRNYYRYADHLFACRQQQGAFHRISVAQVEFELFASGEYSRLLEREWE